MRSIFVTLTLICVLLSCAACQKSSSPDQKLAPDMPPTTPEANASRAPYMFISTDPEDTVDACIDQALVDKGGQPIPMILEVPRLLSPCTHSPQMAPTQAHFTYQQGVALFFVDIDAPARAQLTTLPTNLDSFEGKWSPNGTRWAIAISTDKGQHTHLWSWRFKEGKLTDMSRHKISALTDCSSSSGVCRVGSAWEFQGEDTITYAGSTQDLEPNSHPASGQLVDDTKLTTVSVDLNAKS